MSLSREDLAREIYTHSWREPILRALAEGSKRYGEIRTFLIKRQGSSPGDGYISTELRGMRALGLLEQVPAPGTRRTLWELTDLGWLALKLLDEIKNPSPATAPIDQAKTEPVDESDRQRWGKTVDELSERAVDLNSTVAHPARRYNYWLGGKDNFRADRESGDLIERMHPPVRTSALENRRFLQRAVAYLAGEAGIDQFLDIGTGLPTADNTHEVAQRINHEARVAYVDNDPMVMSHARALLTSSDQGRTCYIEEDLRNPEKILNHPDVARLLDLDRPVALMLVAVLHFLPDDDQALSVVRRLLDALPAGSYLAASNFTLDHATPEAVELNALLLRNRQVDVYDRSKDQFAKFFTGLELVEPGIVSAPDWRSPVPVADRPSAQDVAVNCGVGRKL